MAHNSAHTSPYTLYLSREAAQLLATSARGRHGMRSAIADDAIKYYFDPGNDERFSIMARRLEHMADHQTMMRADLQALMATLKLYIELFLILSPPMPDQDQAAAQALGKKRFDHFMGQLKKAVRRAGPSLSEELFPTDLVTEEDLGAIAFEANDAAFEGQAS